MTSTLAPDATATVPSKTLDDLGWLSAGRAIHRLSVDGVDEVANLRRERDLYLRLLELGTPREVEPFLRDALALVCELTPARTTGTSRSRATTAIPRKLGGRSLRA